MQFSKTYAWLTAPSPHTGLLKTETSRLANALDYAKNYVEEFERPARYKAAGQRNYILQGHVSPLDGPQLEIGAEYHQVIGPTHRLRYRRDNYYKAQPGRGKPGGPFIQILKIVLSRASLITPDEARAEGFRDPEHFLSVWCELHGDRCRDAYRWRLVFKVER